MCSADACCFSGLTRLAINAIFDVDRLYTREEERLRCVVNRTSYRT